MSSALELSLSGHNEGDAFVKTKVQARACRVMNSHRHTMLYGGSRSGKTTIAIRNMILRGTKTASKHLAVRRHFNHARRSLGYETIPKVARMCFPGLQIKENKSDSFWEIPAQGGGTSQLWLGGTDDKERIEKVLGSEYSTIYANECSELPWEPIPLLWTRLAENVGLPLRFYYDCNPPGKKHWSYRLFHEGEMPDGEPHVLDTGHLRLNPRDNIINLPPEYIAVLESLPKRQRQRFLDGLYLSDVEGALWTDEMINIAKAKEAGELRKTVIAVDPSVSNNPGSDECGIIVCSIDEFDQGVIHDDLSAKLSTNSWANRVVAAYYAFEANEVVAEANQGGDLVADVIHSVDPNIKVVLVHASKGKAARAEPVAQLYEPRQEMIVHEKSMPKLEDELTTWVPLSNPMSPNRLDALVWGVTHLKIATRAPRIHVG